MKVSETIRVSQKTDLLSVIRLDARIIVQRWTKMEMRFEIKRGGRRRRRSNLVPISRLPFFSGGQFFTQTKRNETNSSKSF